MLSIEYIAGFFDGEGNVAKTGFIITIVNTHIPTLEAIREVVGGKIKPRNQKWSLGKKSCYYLQICGRLKVRAFLQLIVSFSITKRAAIERKLLEAQDKPKVAFVPRLCYCGVRQLALGLCSKHYQQHRKVA